MRTLLLSTDIFRWFWLSTLVLGLFWAFYYLVLKQERLFCYNRILLLSAPVVAAVWPLLQVPSRYLPAGYLPVIPITPADAGVIPALPLLLPESTIRTEVPASTPISWWLLIYGAGVFCMLARLSWQLYQLWRFTRSLPTAPYERYTLRRTGGRRPTGSFGRTVYWDETVPLTPVEASQVLRHELAHVYQRHTLDRLWLRVWQALLWPNPFVHLLLRALDLTHEYLADAAVATGAPAQHYIRLLACQATGWRNRTPALAHSFFSSSTLIRIAMLNRLSPPRRWKQWLLLPLGCVLLGLVACDKKVSTSSQKREKNTVDLFMSSIQLTDSKSLPQSIEVRKDPNSNTPRTARNWKRMRNQRDFITVINGKSILNGRLTNRMLTRFASQPMSTDTGAYSAIFPVPAGGAPGLLQFVERNTTYPRSGIDAKLEGKVWVNFVVNKYGQVTETSIRRGITSAKYPDAAAEMNAEAVRVVKALPKWTPGTCDGEPAGVAFTIPVDYTLK
ncbi:TonB family protein [Hymenobacter sp. BT507]|uniref:TonB family protein n=1 Tax=Hymenobacter citatus TaxID=2763506 RepID=A0ABR7MHJ3_9BACT|nr:M56 family metallopeptidase [Hymenobacter citatus]MBC6610349.1 TonB family protein [Hymenobacter citatus]